MSVKEFRIIFLKEFSRLREHTDTLHRIWKTIHEQNENFNKDIEITFEQKTTLESLELKNTMKKTEEFSRELQKWTRLTVSAEEDGTPYEAAL